MNKHLKLLVILLVLFLTGCIESEPVTPVEPIDYEINVSNFESFFLIDLEITEVESNQVIVNLEPLFPFDDTQGEVTIKVYLSYMFNQININQSHQLTFNLDLIVEEFITLHESYYDIEVYYVEVSYVVGSLSSGNEITVQDKTYNVPIFTPIHENEILIDNQEFNQQLFEELDQSVLDVFSNTENQYLTYTVVSTSGYTSDRVQYLTSDHNKIQIADNYMYYENATGRGIIQKNGDDRLFHYYMNPLYIVSNRQVLEVSVIESIEDLNIQIPLSNEMNESLFVPDSSKMGIIKDGNKYIITGYLKDLMSPIQYFAFSQQLKQINIDSRILDQSTMSFIFEFSEHELMITSEMSIELPHPQLSLISSKAEILYSYLPFDKIDMYSNAYIVEPADEFNEITEETNVLQEVTQLIHGRQHKYRVFLEKGQYKLIDVDQQRLTLQLYDLEYNRQSFTPLPSHIYGIEIFIPEDGYYYMNINQGTSNNLGYTFYLEPRNYETTWFDNETLDIGTNTVTFEGKLDFVRFKFDSTEAKVLKIFTGSKDINIYPHDMFYADGVHFLEVPIGVSYFTLTSQVARTINLEVTEVDITKYESNVFDSMEQIQEVASNLIVTSQNLGPRYLKLVVTEKAYYKIDFLRAGEAYSLHSAYLLNQNLVVISLFNPAGLLLDIGSYVVRVHTSELSLGYVKYQKEVIEDETKELNMTKMEYNEMISQTVPYYVATLYHKDHYVDYHFNTTESSALYVRGDNNHYQFLDAERNPITMIFGDSFYTEVSQIFYFEPGDYYIRVYSKFDFEHMQLIFLTFLSNPPDDDSKAGSDIPWITLGTHDFEINYPEDTEIFKIDITVQGNYQFYSNITGYPTLYDASFNRIPQQTNHYNLAPGLYYIFLPNRGGSSRSLNISKVG